MRTSAVHLDEVQVVATCATSGVIGGGFTMYYAGPDETRLVPYDADADYMKVCAPPRARVPVPVTAIAAPPLSC